MRITRWAVDALGNEGDLTSICTIVQKSGANVSVAPFALRQVGCDLFLPRCTGLDVPDEISLPGLSFNHAGNLMLFECLYNG